MKSKLKKQTLALAMTLIAAVTLPTTRSAAANELPAPGSYRTLEWAHVATQMPTPWYGTQEAKDVAEIVLKYQTKVGGWAKNTGFQSESNIKQDEWKNITTSGVGATFDNDATLTEMKFLAKIYGQVKDQRYRDAFLRGFEYVLTAQYPNGGWPQYYPPRSKKSAYSAYITYNDDVMVNVLRFLNDIRLAAAPFSNIGITDEMKLRAKEAHDKGLACILQTQIIVDGKRTVWCAQHHHKTLQPAGARSYELPSFSGGESAGVALFLMDIPNPSPEVIEAVQGAVKWFGDHKLTGIRVIDFVNTEKQKDRKVVEDPTAPALWARFYDLETGKPYFSDRDGIKKTTFAELGNNRRAGYRWYVDAPAQVLKRYPEWAAKLAKAQTKTSS